MNHPQAWPSDTITVGGVTYTRDQAIAMLNQSSGLDVTYTMFRALVAAQLNVAIGANSSCITDAIAQANAWLTVNKLGSGVRASSSAWQNGGEALKDMLDQYNNGQLCAPHRDDTSGGSSGGTGDQGGSSGQGGSGGSTGGQPCDDSSSAKKAPPTKSKAGMKLPAQNIRTR